ncbi:ankyrin repeat domain-containing protein [Lysinibacillus sp. NPDC047702]|uniref:ankyrin repeat domain-containing protein n=1 Tax=unclassified Lysinibacillus TaxID=2636778 RepID=UPI003D0629B7
MLVDINCPVELLEYQLYRSKKTGKIYCSFRFNNISEESIKGFNATVYCYDQFGEPVGMESNSFEYTQQFTESIKPNKLFDNGEKISLDNFRNTRKIDIVIHKVLFSDETTWTKKETELENVELKEINHPKQLSYVKTHEGNDAKYYSQIVNDKWLCVCGRLNLEDTKTCKRCKREKKRVLSMYRNDEAINENITLYEKQIEDNKKEELAEKERQHKIYKKKVKRVAKYCSIFISLLLLISIAVYGFITKFTFSWDNYLLLKDKNNSLIEAVKMEDIKNIEFLLKNGADVTFTNKDGENSVSEAIKLPNKKIALSLMNKEIGSIKVGKEKDTLAHIAAINKQYEILKELHQFGVDMNVKNEQGHTVLYYAIKIGNKDMIDYLVHEIKVNLQEVDNEGNNIVQVALLHQFNNIDLIKELLNLDLDFNRKNATGQNTYETAILTQNKDIVQIFIENGLNLNKVDENGNNAIHILLTHKTDNMTFLSELIKKGTNLNGLNKQGQTPLYLAILNGDKNTVEVLLKNKVNLNSVNSNGESAVEIAEKHNQSLVELFERGKFIIKIDKQKNEFLVNGIALGSSRKDVVNRLGAPDKKDFKYFDNTIACNYYYLNDSTGKGKIETEYCFYDDDTIESISFDFYSKHLNEKWYKNLGKPFVNEEAPIFYLKGTEQTLLLKPNEEIGFLSYADGNFYYYYDKN